MRKLFWMVLLLSGITLVTKAQPAAAISGKFVNAPEQDVRILAYKNHINYEIDTLTIGRTNADGEFSLTLLLKQPKFVKLFLGDNYVDLYFTPGTQLYLFADSGDFNNSLQLTGEAATINRYIQVFAEELAGQHAAKAEREKMQPQQYMTAADLLLTENLQFLHTYFDTATAVAAPERDFKKIMQQTMVYSWAEQRLIYPDNHRRHHKLMHIPQLPHNYYGFLDTLQIDNPEMAHIPVYSNFINAYTNYQMQSSKEKVRGESKSPAEWKLDYIVRTFTEDARDLASAAVISGYIRNEEEPDLEHALTLLARFKESSGSNSDAYRAAKQEYNNALSLTADNPAPDFTFKDLDGNTVSLSDFKGKVVYIDFWASWCGPCIMEVPYAKKLHKELGDSNVVFLNISLDEKETAWRKAVQKHGIKGINLIVSGNETGNLAKDYGITSIPHYVLVDKAGNLIENKTARPSGNVKELILQALKKP